MRRIRITITAEAAVDDDRWLSRDVARAAREVAARDSVRSGCSPYAFTDVEQVRHNYHDILANKDFLIETMVAVTYTARFRWWHFLLPAWVLRRLPDNHQLPRGLA